MQNISFLYSYSLVTCNSTFYPSMFPAENLLYFCFQNVCAVILLTLFSENVDTSAEIYTQKIKICSRTVKLV